MKKCIRDVTSNTVMAVAVKRSAGSDATSVGGMVALLVWKTCRSARYQVPDVVSLHRVKLNIYYEITPLYLSCMPAIVRF